MKEEGGKILGVIGGMGPAASELFYKMVIEATDADKDQDHLNMIILSHATMPDRTTAIKEGRTDDLLDKLASDAMYLEQGGATCIAIPCNTTHAVMDSLQQRVGIPIINMIRSTAAYIAKTVKQGSKIGVMATSGTVQMGLYQEALEECGLVPVLPGDAMQDLLMHIIYDEVKSGREADIKEFERIAGELKETDVRRIILGCTELSLIREVFELPPFYVDAMRVLVDASLKMCERIQPTRNTY